MKTKPFVCESVEFTVELSHSDRFRVEHEGVHGLEIDRCWRHLAFQFCHRFPQDFVALFEQRQHSFHHLFTN